ncbi:MAG: glucose 1-dehydrogenase [Caulobacterales bacterium]|nr:glucose 1-dehydrogenase [Caulobacterales bacterium]
MAEGRFAGRKAIVTGAARGIGLAVAQRLVSEGASVLLSDVAADVGEAAAALGQPHLQSDLTAPGAVEALFALADRELGPLDVLVNSAGIIGRAAKLMELAEADFDRVMDINLKVGLLATQAAARRMTPRRSGAIVNLVSVAAVMAGGDQIPYAVSKAAVKQLTAMTALSLAPYGIRVNGVGPGPVETPMAAAVTGAGPEGLKRVLSRIPLGRMARPEEIAAIVAFLASDDASYLTGQTLFADGGRMALGYFAEPIAEPA